MASGVTSETIRVDGLAQLTRKLKLLSAELPLEVRRLNREAAAEAVPIAKSLAPVGNAGERDSHPGKLQGNIRVGATQRSGYIAVGSAGVPYAGPIEFGWPRHNITPHEFLFKAVDVVAPMAVARYELGLNSLIQRVGLAE